MAEAEDIVVPHSPAEFKEFSRRLSRSQSLMEHIRFPILTGRIKSFDRSHGHGFIETVDNSIEEDIFVHVSDIDGEYVPTPGDIVQFRVLPIPPNNKKFQAVHCRIVEFSHIRHVKWNQKDPADNGLPHSPARRRPSNTMTPETGSLRKEVDPPSEYATRATRTDDVREKMQQKIYHGKISAFCREKGFGMIRMEAADDEVFAHISDVEGEYIPLPGDKVRFCLCPIPPRMEKMQAVHVQIEEFCHEKHQKWIQPLQLSAGD